MLLREISYMRRILREADQFLVMIEDTPWHDPRKQRMYEGLAIAVRQHKAVKEWRKKQRTVEQLRAADN